MSATTREVIDDDSAERATSHVNGSSTRRDDRDRAGDGEPPSKKQKLSKEEKKKRSGANKGRRFGKMRDEVELCWKTARGEECEFGDKYERHLLSYELFLNISFTDVAIPTILRTTSQKSPVI